MRLCRGWWSAAGPGPNGHPRVWPYRFKSPSRNTSTIYNTLVGDMVTARSSAVTTFRARSFGTFLSMTYGALRAGPLRILSADIQFVHTGSCEWVNFG